MATAAARSPSMNKQLENLTECPICIETYKDPRSLPCVHSFCLECVEGFSRDKLPGDDVACPLCRKEFEIPECGVKGLPKNFFIEQLKQLTELSGTEVTANTCEGCSADEPDLNKKKTAISLCVECKEKLCQDCVDAHKTVRATRAHRIVQIGEELISSDICSALSNCEIHSNERIQLYCFDCKLAICMMCFVERHQSHKCADVHKVVDDGFRHQMTSDSSNLTECVALCMKLLKQVLSEKAHCAIEIFDAEREINKQAEHLKQLIDQQRDILLLELQSNKSSRMKQVDNVVADIKKHMSFASSLIKYSDELRDKGAASVIARQASSLHDRACELLKLDVIQRAVNVLGSIDVKLDVNTAAIRDNLNGNIRLTVERFVTSTLTHVIPAGDSVVGVTSLNNQLFVVRNPCKEQIEVYDTETFALQRTIRVRGLNALPQLRSLASCATNNCLYANDFGSDTVYRVELTANSDVFKWRVAKGPAGLSVNNTCNVLVMCCNANRIQEYTKHGKLVREIRLKSDITSPFHTVQLSSGQFVVSHWKPVHGVSIVNSNGQVVASYRNKPDSETELLNGPTQLAVDRNDCILVADCNNDRIVLLSSSLQKSQCLHLKPLSDCRLHRPFALNLDDSSARLYVGEYGVGRVLVFDNVGLYNIDNHFINNID